MFHVKLNTMQKKPLYSAEKSEGYKTSKNYKHLKELLDGNINVVCFVNYDISPQTKYLFQDICIANKRKDGYEFCARGIGYLSIYEEWGDKFKELCEDSGVEFVNPTNISK